MAELKKYNYDWFKIAVCAVGLCLLMILMFNTFQKMSENVAELSADGKSSNLVWLVEHVSSAVPVFAVAIALTIFYADKSKYVPVGTQKEKLIISLIVAAFTFIGIMGYVLMKKDEPVGVEDGEKIKTLWESTAVWFVAQVIPFVILISYHAIRAESEEKELATAKEE